MSGPLSLYVLLVFPNADCTDRAQYEARLRADAMKAFPDHSELIPIPPLSSSELDHEAANVAIPLLIAYTGRLIEACVSAMPTGTKRTKAEVAGRHMRKAKDLLNGDGHE